MKKFTKLGVWIFCGLFIFSLTACGSTQDTAAKDPTVISEQAKSDTKEVATPAPEVKEPVDLEFYHKWTEYPEQVTRMKELYEKEHPNVKIKIVVPGGDYAPAIGARAASGNIPDVFMTSTFSEASLYGEQSEVLDNEDYWNQIDPSAYSSVEKDGKKIAIPVMGQTWAIIYNKDVFEKAGITDIPMTLTDLGKVAATLKSKGITPFAATYKTDWTIHQLLLFPLTIDYKDAIKSFEQINKHEIQLKDQSQMIKITKFIDLYQKNLQAKPFSTDFEGAAAMIAKGEAAMMVQGDWTEPLIDKLKADAKLGFIPMPFSDDPKDSRIFIQSSICLHAGKGTKHVNEAKEFLKWMIASDTAKKWFSEDMCVTSPIKGVKPAKGDLLQSSAELVEKYPDQISIWGEFIIPSSVHSAFMPLDSQYVGGKIKSEQWIQKLSDAWGKYVPEAAK